MPIPGSDPTATAAQVHVMKNCLLFCLCPFVLTLLTPFAPLMPGWTAAQAFAQTAEPGTNVEAALAKAGDNRAELERALIEASQDERRGMEFLIANMPDADLTSLTADFLLVNSALAWKARRELPWGRDIPDEIFFNHVLPYANVDEKRDPWRQELFDLCVPIVKDCQTPAEAAQKLNVEVFPKLNLAYSTKRSKPNQSPAEAIAEGKASCTGLSIVLSDACRAVCVPARLVGTPLWSNKRGNHTWVEIWDGDWHFTGACEPDKAGLDRGWFVGDAAEAKRDSFEHAIYATSFARTNQHFPLVWAMKNRSVPGENVTDRYAKARREPTGTVRLRVRVVDAEKHRVEVPVTISSSADPDQTLTGRSRGETADTNDILSFELSADREYLVKAGAASKTIQLEAGADERIVELTITPVEAPSPSALPDAGCSSQALAELRAALAEEAQALSDLATREFALVALTRADASTARDLIWQAHATRIRRDRTAEIDGQILKEDELEMPFRLKVFGEKPEGGRSLWIALHGGGGAPKQVNDQQWKNHQTLYTLEEGIYLTPRAPTNTWNLWHEAHIDRLFGRLIEDLIVLEDVNPDRVYVSGYSAGGDGVYQLAPRMADRWAAAAMMAGHPNGVSLLSLRNVPFALQVGGDDAAYNRNKVGREYGEALQKLRQGDPGGYQNFVKIHDGKPHWMNREDAAAFPWMAQFSRDPVPDRVVWKQTGFAADRSYWLAVPQNEARTDSLVIARRDGQAIEIEAAENISQLLVRLDDRLADLDREVVIRRAGQTLFSGRPARTIAQLLKTLSGRG
ncbi:MAG: polyhydroxyalkanoate depolymerase, partial [Planctomycetaceae bacterium]